MKTVLIAAMAKKGRIIGRQGKLPWHLPEDLANFRKVTMGKPVIMGRKTFESLPDKFRPLPGRKNVVISGSEADRAWTFSVMSPKDALALMEGQGEDFVFVIGGAQIYAAFLNAGLVDEVWMSLVSGDYEWDVRFPEFEDRFDAYEAETFESFEFVRYRKRHENA